MAQKPVTPDQIHAFEQQLTLHYDARRENLIGIDKIANKRDVLIDILTTLGLNDSKFNILLIGPPGYGKIATLEAVVEELNEAAKQERPITRDPELARLVERRVATFRNQLQESACVYDFISGSPVHIYFNERGMVNNFAQDVSTFLSTLIERWEENLLESPPRPRQYIEQAQAQLNRRIREGAEGIQFRLKSLKRDVYSIDFNRQHKATRTLLESQPREAERIKQTFFKTVFQQAYEAYLAQIRPEVIAMNHRRTQETMNKNLVSEERLPRSRLRIDSLSLEDTLRLEHHRQYYPHTEPKLIQLHTAIFKEKYAWHEGVLRWMDGLSRFLSQPTIYKILDDALYEGTTYEIKVGGKEVTLQELIRPKVDNDLSERKEFILAERLEAPTTFSLFGYISTDIHTPLHQGVEVGAIARNHIVIIDDLKPVLEDEYLYSLLLSYLQKKQYTLRGTNVQVEVTSPCILVASIQGDELEDHPLLKQRFQEITFPTQHPVTKETLTGFGQVINRGIADYNKRNKKETLRPFTKKGKGIEALMRHAIASTGYPDKMNAQYGPYLKEALYIASQKTEGDIQFRDIVHRMIQLRERQEDFHTLRRHFLDYAPDFYKKDSVGQGIDLAYYSSSDNVFLPGFGIAGLLGVSAHPGRGKMYSTGKGRLEGKEMEKANKIVFASLRRLTAYTQFDLCINLIEEYDPIDGPSASAVALYTSISAITDLPMTQKIAVTGTLGDFSLRVGMIGGVMEKTYCWYRIAKDAIEREMVPYFDDDGKVAPYDGRGFKEHGFGVLIPEKNLEELLLFLPFYPDLQEDVHTGAFTLFTHRTIYDGLDLLYPGHTQVQIMDKLKERSTQLTEKSYLARKHKPLKESPRPSRIILPPGYTAP